MIYSEFKVGISEFKNEKALKIQIDNDLLTTFTQTFKEPT